MAKFIVLSPTICFNAEHVVKIISENNLRPLEASIITLSDDSIIRTSLTVLEVLARIND